MLDPNEIINIVLLAGLIAISSISVRWVLGTGEKISSLYKDLAKEKEKLRLLKELNPEPKDDNGWEFVYDERYKKIARKHWQGAMECVCEIKGDDYYGYRIAKLLNDGYVSASPEPERNNEVIFKYLPQTTSCNSNVSDHQEIQNDNQSLLVEDMNPCKIKSSGHQA